jgi:hypothetical protein
VLLPNICRRSMRDPVPLLRHQVTAVHRSPSGRFFLFLSGSRESRAKLPTQELAQ